jgi:EAL domain-containing protein (putative c-di-GMP-specific phosphodiesterase class I)
MTDEEQKLNDFKKQVLKIERESLSNITRLDDKQIISKILRLYEETNKK